MLLLLGASIAAFLLVGLPMRTASLARSEASELAAGRAGAVSIQQSLTTLWVEIGPAGSPGLASERVDANLALAQKIEKATDEASAHVHAAQTYLADALSVPLQFHPAGHLVQDKTTLAHLDNALQDARRLAHAATLQLTIAQHALSDRKRISEQLDPSLRAGAWTNAARAASELQNDLAAQQDAAANPENLLDPLWGRWLDALAAYTFTAQQLSLASAAGQNRVAAELAARLSGIAAQIDAAAGAAKGAAPNWHGKTVQPILDTLATELSLAS